MEKAAAVRSGRDLLNFGVGDNESRKAAKRKAETSDIEGSDASMHKKTTDDKMFENRINTAKFLKLSKSKSNSAPHKQLTSKLNYDVMIYSAPSCTCSDYRKNGLRVFCKHILFDCLILLKGENNIQNSLKKRYLEEVRRIMNR